MENGQHGDLLPTHTKIVFSRMLNERNINDKVLAFEY